MKIELDERDLKYINNVNEDLENGEEPILFVNTLTNDYYINFRCVDLAKANNFIGMLLCPRDNMKNLVEENFGIKVNSLNFCEGDHKLSTLKSYLKEFMEKLDNIR